MSFVTTAKMLGRLVLQLSPIIAEYTDTIKKWKKREDLQSGEDAPSRIDRLEKNMELQARLNEQFIAEMKVLKPVIEALNKSFKILFSFSLIAILFSLVALIVVLSR